jgi:iron complex outermembrane recepter protein
MHIFQAVRQRRGGLAAAAGLIALGAGTVAHADDAAPAGGVTDIVVTAQKRQQRSQDVGIPLSVLSGRDLDRLGLESPSLLPEFTTGVQLAQPNGAGSYSFAVRGVTQNDFADHEESPAAIYVDGAYVSQMSGLAFQLFDLDRVEVLRGPQGTLFGRNATGGLAQFISRAPTTELSGYVTASYGSYNEVKTEGAISGSLTGDDRVLARLSFATDNHDPIFKNTAGYADSENNDSQAIRGQVQFNLPDDAAHLTLIGRWGRLHNKAGAWEIVPAVADPVTGYGSFGGSTTALGYPGSGNYQTEGERAGYADIDSAQGTAKLEVPLAGGNATWTTLFDYQWLKKAYQEDSDGSPLDYFEFYNGSHVRQESVETRVNGTSGGIKWIAGAYFLHIDGNYTEGAYGSSYGGQLADVYSLRTTSYAIFGQAEIPLARALNLTVGGRYTWDWKDLDYTSTYPDFSYTFNAATDGALAHRNDGFWSGKIGLDYRFSPQVLGYVSVNRGVKAGSFNAPLDPTTTTGNPAAFSFKPEDLTDYEAGLKTDLFGRRLRVNLSTFYYDYHNYQALRFINLTQLVSNADATYYGGELETQFVPDDHWLVSANVAYSHGTVKDIDLDGQGPQNYIPANAPRWSGNATLRYATPVGGGKASAQIDGNFVSRQYFALTDAPDTVQNFYALLNARLNYTTGNGHWDFGVAVENLTGHHYATMAFDLASFMGLAQRYPGRPRWVSGTVSYHF